MLASIGGEPVNSLEDTNDVDVAMAIQALDRESIRIQTEGWDFNTETKTIRGNALDRYYVKWDNTWLAWRTSDNRTIAKRGDKMKDITNDTFVFDKPFDVSVIIGVDFEDLPQQLKDYVSAKAAYTYQAIAMGDQNISQDIAMDLQLAQVGLTDYDLHMSPLNMLQSTGVMQYADRTGS